MTGSPDLILSDDARRLLALKWPPLSYKRETRATPKQHTPKRETHATAETRQSPAGTQTKRATREIGTATSRSSYTETPLGDPPKSRATSRTSAAASPPNPRALKPTSGAKPQPSSRINAPCETRTTRVKKEGTETPPSRETRAKHEDDLAAATSHVTKTRPKGRADDIEETSRSRVTFDGVEGKDETRPQAKM